MGGGDGHRHRPLGGPEGLRPVAWGAAVGPSPLDVMTAGGRGVRVVRLSRLTVPLPALRSRVGLTPLRCHDPRAPGVSAHAVSVCAYDTDEARAVRVLRLAARPQLGPATPSPSSLQPRRSRRSWESEAAYARRVERWNAERAASYGLQGVQDEGAGGVGQGGPDEPRARQRDQALPDQFSLTVHSASARVALVVRDDRACPSSSSAARHGVTRARTALGAVPRRSRSARRWSANVPSRPRCRNDWCHSALLANRRSALHELRRVHK